MRHLPRRYRPAAYAIVLAMLGALWLILLAALASLLWT